MSMGLRPHPQIPLGAATLLQDRAAASQSQWDPAHGGVGRPMQGIHGDQPPLRFVEALLYRHPLEEEGEEQQAGAAHADGVRRHLASEQSSRRVPANVAIDI